MRAALRVRGTIPEPRCVGGPPKCKGPLIPTADHLEHKSKERTRLASSKRDVRKTFLLTCVAAVLVLHACTPQPAESDGAAPPDPAAATGTPVVTPSSPALPKVASKLGAPPTGCRGPAPDPKPVVRFYGSLLGEKPLWAGMYARYRPEHRAYYAPDARRTKYGFRIKVLWIMHPSQDTPVTVEGRELRNDQPIYMHHEGIDAPVLAVEFDPENPGTVPETNWKEYPSYLFFSRAGCYEVKVTWSGGTWRRVFGFGR